MGEQATGAVAFERLERVKWQRREFHPVGETRDEMAACMAWIVGLGHEAKSLDDDGFRYRSVYPEPSAYTGRNTSSWQWAEPGEWLMHMVGEGQDGELDAPHGEGPLDEDGEPNWSISADDWISTPPAATEADR